MQKRKRKEKEVALTDSGNASSNHLSAVIVVVITMLNVVLWGFWTSYPPKPQMIIFPLFQLKMSPGFLAALFLMTLVLQVIHIRRISSSLRQGIVVAFVILFMCVTGASIGYNALFARLLSVQSIQVEDRIYRLSIIDERDFDFSQAIYVVYDCGIFGLVCEQRFSSSVHEAGFLESADNHINGTLFYNAELDMLQVFDGDRLVYVMHDISSVSPSRLALSQGDAITTKNSTNLQELVSLPQGYVSQIAWSPDGNTLVVGDDRFSRISYIESVGIRLYSLDDLHNPISVELEPRGTGQPSVQKLAFSPGENLFATTGGDQALRIWDAETLTEIITYETDSPLFAFNPSDTQLIYDSDTYHVLQITRAPTSTLLRTAHLDFRATKDFVFTPDGSQLVVGTYDRLLLLTLETMSIREIPHDDEHISFDTLIYSPDASMFVTGGYSGSFAIYDTASLELTYVIDTTEQIHDIDFAPDGHLLATAGDDGVVRLWNTGSWEQIVSIEGHTGEVTSVQFDPTGRYIASASRDGTVKIWGIP